MVTASTIVVVFGAILAMAPIMADAYMLPKMFAIIVGTMLLWSGVTQIRATKVGNYLLTFCVALCITTVASQDVNMSLMGTYRAPFYGVLPLAVCAMLFFASVNVKMDRLVDCILAATSLAAVYAIIQHAGFEPFVGWGIPQGRSISTIGSPPYMGAVFAMALPLFFYGKSYESPFHRLWPLVVVGLYTTGSRMPWIAAAAGVATYMWMAGKNRKAIAGTIAAAIVAAVVVSLQPEKIRCDLIRIETWKSAWSAFLANPWLGSGPDTFTLDSFRYRTAEFAGHSGRYSWQDSAHNDILQIMATMGIVGLVSYVALQVRIGMALLIDPEHEWGSEMLLRFAVAGAFVAAWICAKTNAVPLPVTAILAALLGQVVRSGRVDFDEDLASITVKKTAAVAFMLAASAMILSMCVADIFFLRAMKSFKAGDGAYGARDLKRAMEINPASMEYKEAAINSLSIYSKTADTTAMLREAAFIADKIVDSHPRNGRAIMIRGITKALEATHVDASMAPAAMLALGQAGELIPTEMAIQKYLMFVAYVVGDAATMGAAAEAYRANEKIFELKDQKIYTCPYCNEPWSRHIMKSHAR